MGAPDAVVVLQRALDQAGDLLADVRPAQMSHRTPCADWKVADLVRHLVAIPEKFLAMTRGEQPDWSNPTPEVRGEAVTVFRAGADDLIHAWHQVGEDHPVPVDWQIAELAVHAWDLARATGQSRALDPEVAERGYAFLAANLTPENRGEAFGAPVDVPDDAPQYDRLAALAGRDPS